MACPDPDPHPHPNPLPHPKVPAGFGNATDCLPDPEITVRYVQEDVKQLGVDQVHLGQIRQGVSLTQAFATGCWAWPTIRCCQ